MSTFLRRYSEDQLEHYLSQFPLLFDIHGAEDEGRSEEPTEQKKRKAREDEGTVFFTNELPQALELLVGFSMLALMGGYFISNLRELLIKYLENPGLFLISPDNYMELVRDLVYLFVKLVLPIGAAILGVVVLGTMVQTNFFFRLRNVQFKPDKLIPKWDNIKNKTFLSRTQLVNTIKVFVKIAIVFFMVYLFYAWRFDDIVRAIELQPTVAISKGLQFIFQMIMMISAIFFILAIPDWFIQRMEYLEKLKMSRQQIKEEMKESDGDPLLKQRQRERAREIASRKLAASVGDADVVIRNPTHYSVALSYKPGVHNMPVLVAKGADEIALQIREIAAKNDIPIMENRPLARGIYARVEVGEEVSEDFLFALVEIFQLIRTMDKTA